MFSTTWFKDVAERTISSFVEAALGLWILAGPADVFNLSVAKGAAAAGLIAGLTVLKGALATQIGSGTNASVDPTLVTYTKPTVPASPQEIG